MLGSALVRWRPASAQALVQVSAGGGHSCAIKVDATLACWGSNSDGQATPPGGTFSAVDAGGLHTCAIRTDATVACWGKNDDGESTPPSGTLQLRERRRRSQLRGADGRHARLLGAQHAVASVQRRAGRDLPLGQRGQHGRHHLELRRGHERPHHVLGLQLVRPRNPPPGTFTDAGAGGTHGCALTTDASLACWGGFSSNGAPFSTPPAGIFTAVSVATTTRAGSARTRRSPAWATTPPASHAAGRDLPLLSAGLLPLAARSAPTARSRAGARMPRAR